MKRQIPSWWPTLTLLITLATLPSRLQAQFPVDQTRIVPVVDKQGTAVGFIFPKVDAQKYEHYSNQLIPLLKERVTGLENEIELYKTKTAMQDSIILLIRENEKDLKDVASKLERALNTQEEIIKHKDKQIKAARLETWIWRGLGGAAVVFGLTR